MKNSRSDHQRRRLAVRGKLLGRRLLGDVAGIVTPDTILVIPDVGDRMFGQDGVREITAAYGWPVTLLVPRPSHWGAFGTLVVRSVAGHALRARRSPGVPRTAAAGALELLGNLIGCGPTARCPQLRAAAAGCRKLQRDCYDTVCKPQPPHPRPPHPPNLCDQQIASKTNKNLMLFDRLTPVILKVVHRVSDCSSGTKISFGLCHLQLKMGLGRPRLEP